MRLGKFQSSGIHQIRSGQSHLATQPIHRQRD
jgi:hypothetical protein